MLIPSNETRNFKMPRVYFLVMCRGVLRNLLNTYDENGKSRYLFSQKWSNMCLEGFLISLIWLSLVQEYLLKFHTMTPVVNFKLSKVFERKFTQNILNILEK